MNKKFYQVGGALSANAYSYIKREADDELYNHLKEGNYCYVLNARQVGKSSLRVACSKRLEEEDGFKCVHTDLTSFGSTSMSEEEWYFSFVYAIVRELKISEDEFMDFWDANNKLTVINRFELAIERLILQECSKKIVIFIDEIDFILSIKKFNTDEFFAIIRRFYNLRAEKEVFKRVTFALFGVASVDDLMQDSTRTPFNIAHDIQIHQFKLEESLLLLNGLVNQIIDKRKILEKIFEWTDGTPYLTQKILYYISKNPIRRLDEIDEIIDKLFIQESSNEINITNIQNRIINNKTYNTKMFYIIGRVLNQFKVRDNSSRQSIIYLKLSGLLKSKNGFLVYSNLIYQKVFNQEWLDEISSQVDRPISKPIQKWLKHGQKESFLIQGDKLKEIKEWAIVRDDLSVLEQEYIGDCEKKETKLKAKKELLKEKKKSKKNIQKIGFTFLIIFLLLTIMFGKYYYENKENRLIVRKNKESQENQIELKLNELILDINPPLEPYHEYNIPHSIEEKEDIEKLILNSIRLSKEFDKKFWIQNINFMNKEKQGRLFNILKYYAFMDKGKESTKIDSNNKAIECYKKAIECNDEKPDAYIELGKIYYSQREYQKTLEIYEKIKSPDKKIYFFIGNTHTKLKEYDKAIEYYRKILTIYPNNEKALFNIGDIYIEKRENEKAIAIYIKIIEFNPKSDKALAKIANIYFSQLNYQKAMAFYDKAIEINSNSINLIRSRDLVYKRIEDTVNIKNFYKKGKASTRIGHYKDAISYFKKAIELNRGDYKIYNALGMAYCKLGKYDKSMEAYNHSKKLNSKDALVHELIGHVEYKLKNSRKAIKSYKKAIELNIKDKNININLHSAYINIFHYQLIIFNEIKDKDLERSYVNYFKDKKEFFAYYEALKILEKIYKDNKKVDISDWLKKYEKIALDSQDLDYIRKNWIEKIKQNRVRYKLNDMLKKLKGIVPDINYLSFNQAIEKAKKEQKLVMVFVNEIGCPWCNKLENLLKTNQAIKRIIYQNFEVVKVDKDDIPMNIKLAYEDMLPILLFYESKNKHIIQKYTNIYTKELFNDLKEDVIQWKKEGYLKNTVKDGKIKKFTREGWVYLGKLENGIWIKQYFQFDKRLKPSDLKDSYQVAKVLINIRKDKKVSSKKIGGLRIGEEVQIKETNAIGNDIWAKIKY